MISMLRVLVLLLFAIVAVVLACHKEQHHSTYRLILAFVAVGSTTFFPENAVMLSVATALSVFFLLLVCTQIAVRACASEKVCEKKRTTKRNS